MTGGKGGTRAGGASVTRRRALATVASAAGVGGLAGCLAGGEDGEATPTPTSEYANYPVDGDTARIGVVVPETGVHSGAGDALLGGYRLGAHLLGGGTVPGELVGFESLEEGILGKSVELVVGASDSTREGARAAGADLVEADDVIALLGGASSEAVLGLQEVASERTIPHVGAVGPATELTGESCSRFGFQALYDASMLARALRPALVETVGDNANFAQVYPDSLTGRSLRAAVEAELTTAAGWFSLTAEPTKVGTARFEEPLRAAVDRGPDVVLLHYTGLAGAQALRQAAGIVPADVALAVPLLDRPLARNAGGALAGVLGTVPWDPAFDSPGSRAFAAAWDEAGLNEDVGPPSGLGHLACIGLLHYAAAVERAGTFEPPAVIEALEGHAYDAGFGGAELRACDHRAARPVPVVRGRPASAQREGQYFEPVEVVPDTARACDEAAGSECEMDSA